MIVYLLTNKITGKQYVGQTIRKMSRRWWGHVNDALSEKWDYPLHRAIRKYGEDAFSKDILGIYDNLEDLNNAEEYFIQWYDSLAPEGYNLHSGGRNHTVSEHSRQKMSESRKGRKHTEESKKKMSGSQKGRTFTDETKAQMSKSHTGKVLTQEHKDNISRVNKGKILSDKHIEKMRKVHTGKVFSQEHCDNMSKARLGKIFDENRRMGMSARQKGIKQSEETKKKLSDANKGKFKTGPVIPIICHQNGTTYPSCGRAAKTLGICRPGIQRSIKSGIPYHGFTFSYVEEKKK